MALIEVEIEDYLEEIDTKALTEELARRKAGMDILNAREIAQRLRSAFYRQDASQFEAILTATLDPIEYKEVVSA